MAFPRLADLLGPSQVERLLAAQESQAASLRRLVELAELYLQVDPATLAAAAAAAADPGEILIDDSRPAELRHIEQVVEGLIAALGRVPTDEEVEDELQRLDAVEEAAAIHAQQFHMPGGGGV